MLHCYMLHASCCITTLKGKQVETLLSIYYIYFINILEFLILSQSEIAVSSFQKDQTVICQDRNDVKFVLLEIRAL